MTSTTENYTTHRMASTISSRLRGLPIDTAVKHNAFAGINLGGHTLLMKVPLSQFVEISRVANERTMGDSVDSIAQREIDRTHAGRLAVYILKGVVTRVLEQAKERGDEKMVSVCDA